MPKSSTQPAKRGRPRRGPDPERFREIIDAAAQVFLEKGYSATSIQDISDRVGILKGSLYHYVRSKEDFLYRIIKDVYDEAIEDIRTLNDGDKEPLSRLAEFIRLHVRFAASHLTAYSIQLREFSQLSEERREEIRQGGETYVEAMQRILEDGQSAGVIDSSLDARLASIIITGELNSMTRWYSPQGTLKPDSLADVYIGMVLSSVASDSAVKTSGGVEALRARFTLDME